jgi:uncharacterized protein
MPVTSRASVDGFLALKRIAIVGVSGKDADFSREIFRKFVESGYDVIPVNPKLTEVEGRPCFAKMGDVSPAPEGALILTSAAISEQVVSECAAAGVNHVWLHRGAGQGAVSIGALRVCRENGIDVVAGECPFMFLAGTSFPHKAHVWIKKLMFRYPR